MKKEKHYNIPIFISHFGCPNHCVFCNQVKINGRETDIAISDIIDTLEQYLKTLPKKSQKELAFFGGTFTALPQSLQEEYLFAVSPYIESGDISGIRISTRPDCIDRENLILLKKYRVKAIELGIQSLDEEVLKESERYYSFEQVQKAMKQIHEFGFELGVQMMLGLPASSFEKEKRTAELLIEAKPSTVRIYPTLVLEDTKLATSYQRASYQALPLEEAVKRAAYLLALFELGKVKVIRLGLQTTEELERGTSLLAGPFHPAFRELVETELARQTLEGIFQKEGLLDVFCGEREVSRIIGLNKRNFHYFDRKLKCHILDTLEEGEWMVAGKKYSREERLRSYIDVGIAVELRSVLS